MVSWAEKRRLVYGAIGVLFVLGIIVVPSFLIFYKAPTCFDGKKNGSELDIDCGGKCSRLCQSSFLPPIVAWSKIEKVANNLYNSATYIINPNINGTAMNVPYKVTLFDKDGMKVIEKEGRVSISAHRNSLAFNNLIDVGNSTPVRAAFEFTALPNWEKKNDDLSVISVVDKNYNEEENSSSLQMGLRNDGLQAIKDIAVFSILYDKEGGVIGFSKTIIDEIKPKDVAIAPFTWNYSRKGEVVSIEALYVPE